MPASSGGREAGVPAKAGLILTTLLLVAGVANLNLAVANVALPSIGDYFDASQTMLDLVSVGFSLGLAASVLYLGAIGDRYGRKQMLILGMVVSIPAAFLAAYAPSVELLFVARLIGGLAAGMAYPTTLALITALWSGPARTAPIAMWSGIGGAISAFGPVIAGYLLSLWWWGSVFLVTVPFAVLAIVMAIVVIPSHVNETKDPIDNLGGLLTIVLVGCVVIGINFVAVPGVTTTALILLALAVIATVLFFVRERRAANPLYDLHVAGRKTFWVAAVAGIIVFGALMGGMYLGQQYLQNVLSYSTLASGASVIPLAIAMIVCAPLSAKMITAKGSRYTFLFGFAFVLLGFLTMLFLWKENISYWAVGLGYALVGIGVGFAGTPASRSLTGSVPVKRAGMASATSDLQRDLGGSVLQSVFGALLTAGYAAAFAAAVGSSAQAGKVSDAVQSQLEMSYAGAQSVAKQFPQYADAIISSAKSSFLQGADLAYVAALVFVIIGAVLVLFLFPKHKQEMELLASYASGGSGHPKAAASAAGGQSGPSAQDGKRQGGSSQ